MITKETLTNVINKIVSTTQPQKIILFGSYARSEMHKDSDLDLLIIERSLSNKGKEMVRLRNIIGDIGVGVDVLVYSEDEVEAWGSLPGTALYSALKEGKVIYEAAR